MFYELKTGAGAITITNNSGGIFSITELKLFASETESTIEFEALTEADIRSTVEAMELPEGYTLVDVNYSDVEVAYGEKGTVTFTATLEEAEEPEPEPTPEEKPDEVEAVIGKFVDIIKNLFHKFWWR